MNGPWAYWSLLALAFQAISDDPSPFSGSYVSSHLLKISPTVCLYDVIRNLIDIIFSVLSPEIRENNAVQAPVTSHGAVEVLLDLITVKLAIEIFSCRGIPWTQTFAACYLAHIFVIRIQRRYMQTLQLENAPGIERRRQITRTIFLPATHIIMCILAFTLSGLWSYMMLTVSGTLIMGMVGYTLKGGAQSNSDLFDIICGYSLITPTLFMLNQDPVNMAIQPGAWGDARIYAWDCLCFFSATISGGVEAPNKLNCGLFLMMGIIIPFLGYGLGRFGP